MANKKHVKDEITAIAHMLAARETMPEFIVAEMVLVLARLIVRNQKRLPLQDQGELICIGSYLTAHADAEIGAKAALARAAAKLDK